MNEKKIFKSKTLTFKDKNSLFDKLKLSHFEVIKI